MTMDDKDYIAYSISVASGKIVQSFPRCPDLERKTFDELSRWVETVHGWIYPLSPAGWHTCADQCHVPCDACESVNYPTDRMSYHVILKKAG